MVFLIIILILLVALVVFMLYKLNQRTNEVEKLSRQERRSWMLKVALEKSCQLPTVDENELAKLEPQLAKLMDNAKNDKNVEEEMRELIMSLYEAKIEKAKQGSAAPAVEAKKAKA
jgi:hypothetical protein